MQFHDYAATEASTLIARLLKAKSDGCVHQLRALRDAVEAAAKAIEAAPRPDADVQQLVVKLTAAAQAEADRAAEKGRRATEEARQAIEEARQIADEANAALATENEQNARLAAAVARADAEAARLKSALEAAHQRADAAERDLTATVEAHTELERILTATDTELRRATQARTQLETELTAARASVQRTGTEATQLREELNRVNNEALELRQLQERMTVVARDLREALDGATAHTAEVQQELEQEHSARLDLERQLASAKQVVAERDTLARQLEVATTRLRASEQELERHVATGTQVAAERDTLARQLEVATTRLRASEQDLERHVATGTQVAADRDTLARQLEAATTRLGALEQDLERQVATSTHMAADRDTLARQLEVATTRLRAFEQDLERHVAIGSEVAAERDTLARQLKDATTRLRAFEQDLKQHATTGTEMAAERDTLARQLEVATTRLLAVERDQEQHVARRQQVAAERDALARELEAATARLRVLEHDLTAANETASIELEAALTRVRTVEAALAGAQASIVRQEGTATEQAESARQLQIRLDEALQAEAKLRESMVRASDVRVAEDPTETLQWELERMVSLFDASVRAVNEMARARSSSDLLAELIKRLSIQFSRVALFRVKGQGLEGEHHVGFEDTDIAKLVLPVTVDSLLTRAISSGTVESLTGPDIASRLGTPFGGSPTSAVALPIVLQGTTLAVVYADDADMPDYARGPAVHESSVGFAQLLVGEAAVLLMCHTHELKTLNELRQYATTLLQEAKAMYLADLEAGKPPAQLRGRLKDNLECASQLYAYRAAMEGTAAAALLDDQIALEMAGSTAFSRDLAEVVHSMGAGDLGITAEAS